MNVHWTCYGCYDIIWDAHISSSIHVSNNDADWPSSSIRAIIHDHDLRTSRKPQKVVGRSTPGKQTFESLIHGARASGSCTVHNHPCGDWLLSVSRQKWTVYMYWLHSRCWLRPPCNGTQKQAVWVCPGHKLFIVCFGATLITLLCIYKSSDSVVLMILIFGHAEESTAAAARSWERLEHFLFGNLVLGTE